MITMEAVELSRAVQCSQRSGSVRREYRGKLNNVELSLTMRERKSCSAALMLAQTTKGSTSGEQMQ